MTLPSPNTPTPPHLLPIPDTIPVLTAVWCILVLMWGLIVGCKLLWKSFYSQQKKRKSPKKREALFLLMLWLFNLFINLLVSSHIDMMEREKTWVSISIRGQQPRQTHRQTKQQWSRLLKHTSLLSNPQSVSYSWALWFHSHTCSFPDRCSYSLISTYSSSMLWLQPSHCITSLPCDRRRFITGQFSGCFGVYTVVGGSNKSHRTESKAVWLVTVRLCKLYALFAVFLQFVTLTDAAVHYSHKPSDPLI